MGQEVVRKNNLALAVDLPNSDYTNSLIIMNINRSFSEIMLHIEIRVIYGRKECRE